MTVYFDPSFLIALYLPESSSAPARALVEQLDRPILLNELQEFEFKNSIRQKVVRKEITEAALARSLRASLRTTAWSERSSANRSRGPLCT